MLAEIATTHRATTLVASYCFPPYSDTAAVVAAKRVRQQGDAVDVIYNAMDSVRALDPSLLSLCGGLVRQFAAVPSPTHFSKWESVTAFSRMGMNKALEWEQDQEPYQKLYSRAHFAASHILGAVYALARPDVRWTAEFSDPLSHDVLGRVRRSDVTDNALSAQLRRELELRGFHLPGNNVFEWAEVLPFALADKLLFTNPNQRDIMLERCHDAGLADLAEAKATVSPHPTLPRKYYHRVDSSYELDDRRRHIGYFGNFYANRSMQTVVEALEAVPTSVRNKLTVHVFTTKVEELRADPQVVGLGDSMVVRPYAHFLEFLNLCTKMDCLLVNDAATPPEVAVNPFLPSKISDYKGSGTPVWGIVEPGSRLDHENLTYRSPVDHVSAAVQVLAQVALT